MRIAIIAPFRDFTDSYSLASVVTDQAHALTLCGHTVEVWSASSHSNGHRRPVYANLWWNKEPSADVQRQITTLTASAFERFKPEAIITHDCIFQSGYIDFAWAIRSLLSLPCRWFHYVHSAIGPRPAQIDPAHEARYSLPSGHKIIYPNSVTSAVAPYFGTDKENVLHCPNVHDTRLFASDNVKTLLDTSGALASQIVQVYPVCSTRFEGKGLTHVIRLFETLATSGASVTLFVLNPNAGPETHYPPTTLKEGTQIVYLSKAIPSLEKCGMTLREVSDMFRCSNLFFFPTMAEAGPLVLLEAIAAGCYPIVNSNVPAMQEYAPEERAYTFDAIGKTVQYHKTEKSSNATGEVVRVHSANAAYSSYINQIARDVWETLISGKTNNYARRWNSIREHSREVVGKRLSTLLTTV